LPGNLTPDDRTNPYAQYGSAQLYEFLATYELPRAIGSQYEYSNLGMGLLGHLLAARDGVDYETPVAARILLQRSPELTQVCSPEMDHTELPVLTRASADAHEAALPDLPPLVCAGPPRRSSPACLFDSGVSDRSARQDASRVAST
jgi:hypothetical protein